jgi:ankyrin repeat protein
MKTIRLLAVVVLAAPVIVGCSTADDPGVTPSASDTPTASALVFDPDAPLDAQMKAAIDADDASLVTEILAAGYDPAADLGNGANALHRAAAGDRADLVPILVDAGVPLEAKSSGLTPLHLAASQSDAATVTALLEAGADPVATFARLFGATPMHLAAEYGNIEAIDALLAWGVDIDIKETTQGTPLIYAALFGQAEAVQHLIDLGADLNARDNSGLTALGWVDPAQYPEVAAILEDAGATL